MFCISGFLPLTLKAAVASWRCASMALRRVRTMIRQPAAIELIDRKNYTDGPLAASTNATFGCACSTSAAIETDRMCR
jgi:hypothetical protein